MPFKDPERAKAYEAARREEHNAYKRTHYAADPIAARARQNAWRAANPERVKASRDAHRDERRAYNNAYDAAHREERAAYLKAYMKTYREEHRDELKAYAAANRPARYAARRDENRAYSTAYYYAHYEEEIAKRAAYREAHRDKFRDRRRRAYTKNPAYFIENAAQRRAAVANAACAHLACLALGPIELAWQTNPHRCYLCGVSVAIGRGGNLHFDHVIPIARGGLHCAENLRPACGECNRRKGAKTLAELTHSAAA